MPTVSRVFTLLLVGVIFGALLSITVVFGDTVNLTNGRSIDARDTATESNLDPDSDPRSRQIPAGKTRLLFSNGGWQDIPNDEIKSIEENDEDAFDR
jgi:hypothetical protein